MPDTLRRAVARPFLGLWLTFSPHSWKRRLVPRDSPHVSAPGTNADRVLIAGDGVASGRGVVTHELGLPGFLARALSAQTTRATEVDIVVDDELTALTTTESLAMRTLDYYDIVVLSIGANEALSLMAPSEWELAARTAITTVRQNTPRATRIFVLATPEFGINRHFPQALATVVDFHVGVLNTITEQLADEHAGVFFVPDTRTAPLEEVGSGSYRQWARAIADRIAVNLDPDRPLVPSTADEYERSRQRAFAYLETLFDDDDQVLDRLTTDARRRFGTEMAAITFVGPEEEVVRGAAGFAKGVYPRSDAMCDVTIRRDATHVIEDARSDHRYQEYSVVSGPLGVRFYAGQPIESPDGYRIGALCVMDSRPRRFSEVDATDLRLLAQRVQRHLYRGQEIAAG